MKTKALIAIMLFAATASIAQEEEVQKATEAGATLSAKVVSQAEELPKAQMTKVDMSSHTFNDGVHTTFKVDFEGVDSKDLELFWKKQLKDMSEDLETKKHLTAIGTRIPTIHTDTLRVLGAAVQPKKSPNSSMHLTFIVDRKDVGTSEGAIEDKRILACKEFVYTRSIQFKRERIEAELEESNKALSRLEKAQEGLVKEKERAEKAMDKNLDKGKEGEKDKAKAEAELKSLAKQIETKQAEVASDPSEANTAALNEMLGDREKATSQRDKADKMIVVSDKKVKDLQFAIKKNIEDQANTKNQIEKAKEMVESVAKKLADLS